MKMNNEPAGDVICSVWNTPCKHASECQTKHRSKIQMILDLKSGHELKSLEEITSKLLFDISLYLEAIYGESQEVSSVMHYLNNGIGAYVDNSVLDCDMTKSKTNKVLKRYVKNIFRLQSIYTKIRLIDMDDIPGFVQHFRQMHLNRGYILTLNQFSKILNTYLRQ